MSINRDNFILGELHLGFIRSDDEGYQDEINGVYNASPFRISEPNLIQNLFQLRFRRIIFTFAVQHSPPRKRGVRS